MSRAMRTLAAAGGAGAISVGAGAICIGAGAATQHLVRRWRQEATDELDAQRMQSHISMAPLREQVRAADGDLELMEKESYRNKPDVFDTAVHIAARVIKHID